MGSAPRALTQRSARGASQVGPDSQLIDAPLARDPNNVRP